MKSCPQCGRSFPDEYSFCLSDGATLISEPVRADEEATLVRPKTRDRIKTSTILLFILAIILTLTLGATIGVLYVFWPRQQTAQQTRIEEASPTPTVTPRESKSTPTPGRTVQPTTTPVPSTENMSTGDGPALAADPGVTRISFRPGRVGETVSGSVIKNRAYVLYAKNGQNLIATVRSNGGCVTFDGGSPRISYPTNEGNNTLTLVNNCGDPAPFRLTVRIR